MKKLNFIMGLVLVLFASLFVASCNNDDEESLEQEFAHVLDNHGVAYSFSDNGNCFGDGGGIVQADFDNMFIGHGWKHYATWEIDKNGKRKSAEYYSNMLGLAPENYYFDSDTKLTTYCRSDISGGAVKKNEVTYTGWILGAQPSFCMVHPLGIEADGTTVYGVSIYVQMTDKELKAMQDSAK